LFVFSSGMLGISFGFAFSGSILIVHCCFPSKMRSKICCRLCYPSAGTSGFYFCCQLLGVKIFPVYCSNDFKVRKTPICN
jgi:hypothetical protein